LQEVLHSRKVGESVSVKLIRGGSLVTVNLTLAARP